MSEVTSKDSLKFLLKNCEICSNLKGENSNATLFESELEVRTLEEQINMIPALRTVFCINRFHFLGFLRYRMRSTIMLKPRE